MARMVYSDDSARRLEYRHTIFGYRVRIPMIVAGFVLVPISLVIAWAFTMPLNLIPHLTGAGVILFRVMCTVILGPLAVIVGLRWFDRHITPERPIRYWLDALKRDLNAPRRPTPTTQVIDSTGLRFLDELGEGRRVVEIPLTPLTVTNDDGHHH